MRHRAACHVAVDAALSRRPQRAQNIVGLRPSSPSFKRPVFPRPLLRRPTHSVRISASCFCIISGIMLLLATSDLSFSCSPAPCAERPLRQASRSRTYGRPKPPLRPRFRPKTAFQGYQRVHRANLIGLQRVDLARGAKAPAAAGERARPSAARGSGRVLAEFRWRDADGLAEVALEDRETVEVLGEGDVGNRSLANWVRDRGAAFLEPAPHHAFSWNRTTGLRRPNNTCAHLEPAVRTPAHINCFDWRGVIVGGWCRSIQDGKRRL